MRRRQDRHRGSGDTYGPQNLKIAVTLIAINGLTPLVPHLFQNADEFLDPDTALGRMEQTVAAAYYAGDAFPLAFPVSPRLVAIQAAYLGGNYSIECCMISPAMFNEFFLPSLRRQTQWVERTIYHLDGPGAIRHLDALLHLDTLDGIQWVPGTGEKPMREWIPLLKRIQDGGKLLVVACIADEVLSLLDALRPEGVLLQARGGAPDAADALVDTVATRF